MAASAKGIEGTALAGEEAMTGPWAVLSALDAYIRTLRQIVRNGAPLLDPRSVRHRPGERVGVEVFPRDVRDRLLLPGLRAEVWMERDVSEGAVRETMAPSYRSPDPRPRVALVLGAGNVSSIGPLDALYKLIAEGCATLLKVHPLLEYLLPVYETAFAPLVAESCVRFVIGDAETGKYLCAHPGVDEIHVTGSTATHAAIAAANHAGKPMSSELGNVSPIVVIPGSWSEADLRYAAEQIASAKLHNGGFNCVAPQVLILPAQWKQRTALLDALGDFLRRAQDRPAYYPGARERLAGFTHGRSGIRRFGREDDVFTARAIVEMTAADSSDQLLRTEAFCSLLAVLELEASGVEAYLRDAVAFCNERLGGDLAATLLVDGATQRRYAAAIEEAIAALRYGIVGVNVWSGVAFLLPDIPWGAYRGSDAAHESGTGVVHNGRLFSRSEKAVLRAPFRSPLPAGKPPWFLSNRNQARIGDALCRLQATNSPLTLAQLGWLARSG